jgi:MFS family permease
MPIGVATMIPAGVGRDFTLHSPARLGFWRSRAVGLRPRMASPSSDAADLEPVGPAFVGLYVLSLTGIWVALLTPVIEGLAIRVNSLVPIDQAAGDLSHITVAGAICALVANAFWGRLSDRTTSRWGKRRPWLVIGALGGSVGLLIVAAADSIFVVAVGWCIAQVMYNAALSALTATIPDHVPQHQRGLISGLVGASLPLGVVAGTFLVRATHPSMLGILLVPAIAGIAAVLVFACVLDDRSAEPQARPRYTVAEFLDTFWINPVKHRDFAWIWFSRLVLWTGIAGFTLYKVYFLIFELHKRPADIPDLILTATVIGAAATISASVAGGRLSDRLGRRKVFVAVAGMLYGVGLLVIAATKTWDGFLLGTAIAGAGQGLFLGVDLALANDVLPSRETAARDLGVLNMANTIPQALAPTFGPLLLAINGPNNYMATTIAGAVFAVIGGLLVLGVRGVR